MTHKEQIISFLKKVQKPVCDDCISKLTNIIPRQTIYQNCTLLRNEGKINRTDGYFTMCAKNKKVSSIGSIKDIKKEASGTLNLPVKDVGVGTNMVTQPWYWEGNVQAQIVKYLAGRNYSILSVANTAARTSGKDIVAINNAGQELWVSVIGYPDKSQNTQARHWFSSAIFDLVLYKDGNPNVKLAIGLPYGFATYTNLASRIIWLKGALPYTIIWVKESGEVLEA